MGICKECGKGGATNATCGFCTRCYRTASNKSYNNRDYLSIKKDIQKPTKMLVKPTQIRMDTCNVKDCEGLRASGNFFCSKHRIYDADAKEATNIYLGINKSSIGSDEGILIQVLCKIKQTVTPPLLSYKYMTAEIERQYKAAGRDVPRFVILN